MNSIELGMGIVDFTVTTGASQNFNIPKQHLLVLIEAF